MDTAPDAILPRTGCSRANRLSGEDPVGTVTPAEQLVLVQVPRPWERSAVSTPHAPPGLAPACADAARRGVHATLLLFDGDEVPDPGAVRVVHLRRPPDGARRYEQRAFRAPAAGVAELVARLLAGEDAEAVRGAVRAEAAPRELYVCTHAGRDACCGTYGDAAYRVLRERHARPGLALWRVSHLGGHRFAPTVLEAPDAHVWGKLTPEGLSAIVERDAEPSTLAGSYRGWYGVPKAAQPVERAVFGAVGWAWLGAVVRARLTEAAGATRVELAGDLPDGRTVRAVADVVAGEPVMTPTSCGQDPVSVPQHVVRWLERP